MTNLFFNSEAVVSSVQPIFISANLLCNLGWKVSGPMEVAILYAFFAVYILGAVLPFVGVAAALVYLVKRSLESHSEDSMFSE